MRMTAARRARHDDFTPSSSDSRARAVRLIGARRSINSEAEDGAMSGIK
jgi:hypothetical protein